MITLFQFYRAWGLPNISPFCMKLETYLRMTNIPYECRFVNNPRKSPKRKLPCIKLDGTLYADSELIIDELKVRFGDVLDKELTPEQSALADLINLAFCERLYWVAVYMRWQEDAGWSVLKDTMFRKLPAVSRLFIPNLVRKSMLKQLDAQGMGRHNSQEVLQLGVKTLDHLATLLAENKYFLGDKPSSVDATAFAFFATTVWSPLNDPLKQHVVQKQNILAYCNRMWDEYYPDLAKPVLRKM
ncbi:glutathione S-transferase family protein [uncultured Legionella sp.]|uniref:glutathione S-transferase family protein n=1 Tax=uncultured Legionella sp. TaxID=210934 RepID=UPI00261E56B8|nr:glutathione S-transferase family protein [uncultured Legionella sp.]